MRSDNTPSVRPFGEARMISLWYRTVAEGVERTVEAVKLQSLGCHLPQGYLYGKTLPAEALGCFPTDGLSLDPPKSDWAWQ